MVNQPVRTCNALSYDICVVAVCEYASPTESRREEALWPGRGLPMGSPGALPVPGQTMDKADVDRSVRAVVQNLYAVRERGDRGTLGQRIRRSGFGSFLAADWAQPCPSFAIVRVYSSSRVRDRVNYKRCVDHLRRDLTGRPVAAGFWRLKIERRPSGEKGWGRGELNASRLLLIWSKTTLDWRPTAYWGRVQCCGKGNQLSHFLDQPHASTERLQAGKVSWKVPYLGTF
ncbi:MAG: hypothetical protein JWP44_4117 [Mucilaginibacter sp.]|jgi:hypothetical protein|nr:hypothetical protein [Mucilaginibacter sp.]